MKKMIVGLCFVLMLFAGSAFGAAWTDALSGTISGNGGDVIATGDWSSASLNWDVSLDTNTGLWTYTYEFDTNSDKGAISHFNLELSTTITAEITDDSPRYFVISQPYDDVVYGTFADENGNDDPGLPVGAFYGLKYNYPDSLEEYLVTFTIITSRTPMAGDFYAKNGDATGDSGFNYFWANNAIPVPNTEDTAPPPVPIPGAVVILGFGLLGLVGARKKFVK